MKKFRFLPILFLVSACSLFGNNEDPIDKLPPLTTEGKNTFGCLVNGEVFIPEGRLWSSGLTAQSQEERGYG